MSEKLTSDQLKANARKLVAKWILEQMNVGALYEDDAADACLGDFDGLEREMRTIMEELQDDTEPRIAVAWLYLSEVADLGYDWDKLPPKARERVVEYIQYGIPSWHDKLASYLATVYPETKNIPAWVDWNLAENRTHLREKAAQHAEAILEGIGDEVYAHDIVSGDPITFAARCRAWLDAQHGPALSAQVFARWLANTEPRHLADWLFARDLLDYTLYGTEENHDSILG